MTLPPVAQDLLASKKFVVVTLVTLAVLGALYLGAITKEQATAFLAVVWPVYLGSQGVADVGAKIAAGHVAREEIYAGAQDKKNAAIIEVLNQGMPLFIEAVSKGYGGSTSAPVPVSKDERLLKKGDKVLLLSLGPVEMGDVLEDQDGDLVNVRFPSWKEAKKTERALLAYVDPAFHDSIQPKKPVATASS